MEQKVPNTLDRLKTSFSWGPVVGIFAVFFTILELIALTITEWWFPESDIDIARNFDN
jgi:hypothetical protein